MAAQMVVMMAATHGIETTLENYMPSGAKPTDRDEDDWDVMFPGVAEFAAKLASAKKKE